MKIAIIVSDATAMIHTGAELHRTVSVFDLPQNIADYITKANASGSYTTISLAVCDEPPTPIPTPTASNGEGQG